MKNIRISTSEFKNLKFEYIKNEHVVALVDKQGYEIIKGYGVTTIDAINDLHNSLI